MARHIGRLGNNLFQLAAAIGYARRHNYQWCADPGSGLGEPYSAIHNVYPLLPKRFVNGNRYHEHPHGICPIHQTSFDNCHFDYHRIPDLGPNVTLSGFFQSWKYFEGSEEEIKKVFNLPHWSEYDDYVSIHVRRTDYVTHSQSFPPVTMDYLNKAMGHFPSDQKYIVCSDDITWCRENLKGDQFEFSQRTVRQDMEIQASCKGQIISNSTFSWWAAYLGHNEKRKVISPSCIRGNWFGADSGVKRDCIDLLPPSWTQIKFR